MSFFQNMDAVSDCNQNGSSFGIIEMW